MPKGDCYEANLNFLIKNNIGNPTPDRLILVHAEINGQGPLEGKTFGHCWIENMDTGYAMDFSNDRETYLPIQVFRDLAGVDEIGNEYRYTWEEARKQMLKTEVYGPWELKTAL